MNLYALISLLALEAVITLGLLVYHRSPKNKLNRLFLVLCIIQSYTIFVDFGLQLADDNSSAVLWMKLGAFWPLYLSYMLHFALFFTGKKQILNDRLILSLNYLPSLLTSFLLITDIIKVEPQWSNMGWVLTVRSNEALFNLMLVVLVLQAAASVILYFNYYIKSTDRRKKNQARYILYGFLATVVIGAIANGVLPLLHVGVPNMTPYAILINSLFIAYAIWKYELFTLSASSTAELIMSTINDALIVVNHDGRIKNVNKAFTDLLGFDEKDVADRNISLFFKESTEASVSNLFDSLKAKDSISEIKAVFEKKSGDLVPVSLSASLLKTNYNTTHGIVLIARDISERNKAEQELIQAKNDLDAALKKEIELNDMKSRFISNVSHEYRTPLTVILSSTYLLDIFFEKNQKKDFDKHVRMIQNAVKTMTQLLESVLTLGRTDAGKLEISPVSLNISRFLEELLYELELTDNNNHVFEYTCCLDNSHIVTDEKLMRLIVGNLLSNAAKYSAKGKPVRLELNSLKEKIQIKVSDQGIGIPSEEIKYLYQPFFRCKNIDTQPGTGLGLAIVKRSVDLLNGNITVNSNLNEGTTFTVEVPSLN